MKLFKILLVQPCWTNRPNYAGPEPVWLSVILHYRVKIPFPHSYDLGLISRLFIHIQVKKWQVDNYRGGQRVPHCQLRLQWTRGEPPVVLYHKLKLIGAKEPFNFLTIESDPLPQGIHSVWVALALQLCTSNSDPVKYR